MNDNHVRSTDLHSLFFTSQNEDLQVEERQEAEQGLRELSAGHVYVPPPTVLLQSQQGSTHDLNEIEGTPKDQASKETSATPGEANNSKRKARVTKNPPRKPLVIPPNVEIIILSSDSEEGTNSVNVALRKRQIRTRIYHPQSFTSTSWRCPVTTCRRHDPEFGFQNHAFLERHISNRHVNELVYPCISGCSLEFSNGREWERHHRSFHADEMAQ